MPSESDSQLHFMRMVKARQAGHKVGGPKVAKAASTMKRSSVEHFQKKAPRTILGGRKAY